MLGTVSAGTAVAGLAILDFVVTGVAGLCAASAGSAGASDSLPPRWTRGATAVSSLAGEHGSGPGLGVPTPLEISQAGARTAPSALVHAFAVPAHSGPQSSSTSSSSTCCPAASTIVSTFGDPVQEGPQSSSTLSSSTVSAAGISVLTGAPAPIAVATAGWMSSSRGVGAWATAGVGPWASITLVFGPLAGSARLSFRVLRRGASASISTPIASTTATSSAFATLYL